MYEYIYFDLDDTLVQDNPVTGKSEILGSGLEKYNELVEQSPNARKILLTNRSDKEIKYPEIFFFDEVIGREEMDKYIKLHIQDVNISHLSSLKNVYLYLRGKALYKRKGTYKLLYIFLRSVIKGNSIYILDDDKRVSGMFNK